MKFIKIILAVVTPYFLAATDVWGDAHGYAQASSTLRPMIL
jgi:hypothetical protein